MSYQNRQTPTVILKALNLTVSKNMGEYEVERIIEKRNNKGQVEYQVKWKGYPHSENTWEPEANLKTCRAMVIEFNRNQVRNPIGKKAEPTKAVPPAAKKAPAKDIPRDTRNKRKTIEEDAYE